MCLGQYGCAVEEEELYFFVDGVLTEAYNQRMRSKLVI